MEDLQNSQKPDNWLENYYRKHRCCPQCGQSVFMFMMQPERVFNVESPENYSDQNLVICRRCDWRGTINQLTENCL